MLHLIILTMPQPTTFNRKTFSVAHGEFLVRKIQNRRLLIEIHAFPLVFVDRQLWKYSDADMILENKVDTWMYGNKTWTMPKENGEGYIEDIENNLSVLGLMFGKLFFKLQPSKYQIQKYQNYLYSTAMGAIS